MTFAIGVAILLVLMVLAVPIGYALGVAGAFSLAMLVPVSTIQVLMGKVVHETVGRPPMADPLGMLVHDCVFGHPV